MFEILRGLSLTAGVACIAVLMAIGWDFVVGWRKAAERGEARTSYAMSRTVTKLATYYGALGVGFSIDLLLNIGRLWEMACLPALCRVPVVMIVVAVFECAVELFSIQESADAKLKKRMGRVTEVALGVAGRTELTKAIADAITEVMKNGKSDEDVEEREQG